MVINLNWIIRTIAIILFALWVSYWLIMAQIAKKEKPKSNQFKLKSFFEYIIHFFSGIFLLIQLCGVRILPFPDNYVIQIIGLFLLVIGIMIAISARIVLASNWTGAAEYQIKKGHELITKGIYRYIRHPIYFSLLLNYTAGLVISQTYLFIPFSFMLLFFGYTRGKREEKILVTEFGDKYVNYIKSSKMLIPFIF